MHIKNNNPPAIIEQICRKIIQQPPFLEKVGVIPRERAFREMAPKAFWHQSPSCAFNLAAVSWKAASRSRSFWTTA